MSERKDPAFLFYPADFLIGTMDMTDEEVGVYIRLLCRQHQKGNIDPKLMSDLSTEVLSKFCTDNQGNYYNKRLKREIDKRNKYAESRRSNRLKGAQSTKHMSTHMSNISKTHDTTYEKHMENENINIDIDLIISFLNKTCSSKYKSSSKEAQRYIKARLKDGFTVEDFKTVIQKKYNDWHGTEYAKYLRPSTLFGNKFEEYLNQNIGSKNKEAGKLKEFYGMADEWAKEGE